MPDIEVLSEEWQSISLTVAMVTRMQANYELFAELTEKGDAKVFANIVSLVWEFAAGHNQRIDFQKQIDKLEEITPDPAQFDIYGVWPALDATVALSSLLSCCQRWDKEELEAVLTLSHSTIEQYLDAIGQVGDKSPHPLMLAEESIVQQLLEIIRQQPSASRVAVVAQLKACVNNLTVSNIGLER